MTGSQSIHFEGNNALDSDALIDGLALHRTQQAGRAPDPYLVTVDADRIRGKYLRIGYIDVDVRPARRAPRRCSHGASTRSTRAARARPAVVIEGLPPDDLEADSRDPRDAATRRRRAVRLRRRTKSRRSRCSASSQTRATRTSSSTRGARRSRDVGRRWSSCATRPARAARSAMIKIVGVDGDLADAIAAPDRVPHRAITTRRRRSRRRSARCTACSGSRRCGSQPDTTDGDVVAVEVAVAEGARHESRSAAASAWIRSRTRCAGAPATRSPGWPWPLDDVRSRSATRRTRCCATAAATSRASARSARLSRIDFFAAEHDRLGRGRLQLPRRRGVHELRPAARDSASTTPLGTPQVQARVGWQIEQLGFRDISPVARSGDRARGSASNRTERIGAYTAGAERRPARRPDRADGRASTRGARRRGHARSRAAARRIFRSCRSCAATLPLGPTSCSRRAPARRHLRRRPGDRALLRRRRVEPARLRASAGCRRRCSATSTASRVVPIGGAAIIDTSVEARVPLGDVRKMGSAAWCSSTAVTSPRRPASSTRGNLHWAVGLGAAGVHDRRRRCALDVGYRLNRTGAASPSRARTSRSTSASGRRSDARARWSSGSLLGLVGLVVARRRASR